MNEPGAQLRATASPTVVRSDHVQYQKVPRIDWTALWLVSCSALLGGPLVFNCEPLKRPPPLASVNVQFQ